MGLERRAHGRFQLTVNGNILCLKAKGQWNLETALDFEEAWRELATSISHAPWAHIAYLDEWDLNTPDVEPVIKAVVGWSIANNMSHVAQVYAPSMIKKYELDKMVGDKDLPFRKEVFVEEKKALQWLAENGFSYTE